MGGTRSCEASLVGSGGCPEGAEALRLDSEAPSGPLCFFLRTEKEELTCIAQKENLSLLRAEKIVHKLNYE